MKNYNNTPKEVFEKNISGDERREILNKFLEEHNNKEVKKESFLTPKKKGYFLSLVNIMLLIIVCVIYFKFASEISSFNEDGVVYSLKKIDKKTNEIKVFIIIENKTSDIREVKFNEIFITMSNNKNGFEKQVLIIDKKTINPGEKINSEVYFKKKSKGKYMINITSGNINLIEYNFTIK